MFSFKLVFLFLVTTECKSPKPEYLIASLSPPPTPDGSMSSHHAAGTDRCCSLLLVPFLFSGFAPRSFVRSFHRWNTKTDELWPLTSAGLRQTLTDSKAASGSNTTHSCLFLVVHKPQRIHNQVHLNPQTVKSRFKNGFQFINVPILKIFDPSLRCPGNRRLEDTFTKVDWYKPPGKLSTFPHTLGETPVV